MPVGNEVQHRGAWSIWQEKAPVARFSREAASGEGAAAARLAQAPMKASMSFMVLGPLLANRKVQIDDRQKQFESGDASQIVMGEETRASGRRARWPYIYPSRGP